MKGGYSVTAIGKNAFSGSTELIGVTIHDSIISIGESAFSGCSSLASVIIPNSVVNIKDKAFVGCTSLTSILIPNSVTTVGSYCFANCINLQTATCLNTVVGSLMFEDCNNLRTVILGDSITTIRMAAFRNCNSLTEISLPQSLRRIDEVAFNMCDNLTSVFCEAARPPILDNNAFSFNILANGSVLIVPCEAVELYTYSDWYSYFNEISCVTSSLADIERTNTLTVEVYPNPTEDFATLKLENLTSNAELIVFDIQGKALIRKELIAGEKETKLDLTTLASGTYTVRITSSEGMTTRKLIKR